MTRAESSEKRPTGPEGEDSAPPLGKGFAVLFWLAVTAMLILFAAAALGVLLIEQDWLLSVQEIEELIRSWGHWGVAASIGLMVLHSFVPFPAEFVAIANGMLYGPVWGTLITWIGAMLGAFVAFGLARAFGRPFVERMVAQGIGRCWTTGPASGPAIWPFSPALSR